MNTRLLKAVISIVMGISSYSLMWYLYDWKLPLLIFFAIWANNLSAQLEAAQKEDRENKAFSELLKDVLKK